MHTGNIDYNRLLEGEWYAPFCNQNEIDRILSPQNPHDFLLQERANIVVDNTRFLRVYMNKARYIPGWSFEKSFFTRHYESVLNHLSAEDLESCKTITYGDMFSNDVNGYARNEPKWGRIICLNESLQFYMKFCNLAIMNFDTEIPPYIRMNALRIAIRTMLKVEAMDFFLDPRGIVPENVGNQMHAPIESELQFIAGHEFAHHLCGHLNDNNVSKKSILKTDSQEYFAPVYNISQKQEFESDIASLTRPHYSSSELCSLLNGALLWFISLELGEIAQSFINPAFSFGIKTHPTAQERFSNILDNVDIPKEFDLKKILAIKENAKILGELLLDDISTNFEAYEFFGSVYLDKPNTEWRGRELVDRKDY